MVKLDVTCMRHLSKHDIRVLTAVEVSQENHSLHLKLPDTRYRQSVDVLVLASINFLRCCGFK